MSNTPQTEAQRLADDLENDLFADDGTSLSRRSQAIADEAAAELRRLDAVEAENKRLKDRLDFHLERSAQREQRLWVWAHEELSEPLKTRYFNIVANGTADVMEQPVYAQQFNIMRHRAEAAEAERDQLKKQAASVRSHLVDSLAFALCEQDGNDDPHHLIWDGQPENGPWGEVWQKYLPDAEALAETALKSASDWGLAFDEAEAHALKDELRAQLAKAVAEEREACAKVCDRIDLEYEGEDVQATWCSAAIRARSNT